MTEIYGLFDAADPEAPDRVYTSEAFARLFRTIMRDGIVHNDGDELAVSPTVPAAMSVNVGTGMALVQGRYYINSADLTLTVEAADPSYPRIDRVVVRADLVGRTVHAVVKKGTAAASPVAPPLTRTAEIWELSLAQVRVEAGATSILSAKITDERGNMSLCGVACPVYVPSTQLEVVGAVDMQGKALTGLPVPSAATDAARRDMGGATLQNLGAPVNANDAARKAYVDDKVAGFGISDIAIDANKNWNGKNITNVGQFSANYVDAQFTVVPSDVLLIQKPLGSTFTVRSKLTGVGYVKAVISAPEHFGGEHPRVMTVTKNGVEIWTRTQGREQTFLLRSYTEAIPSIPVVANDVLMLSGTTDTGGATMAIYGSAHVPITSVIT